ncbi:MAG: choice-of-anchor L domain-containing protein, partial [Bacteroidota bacterium]|nr:choice-of-anchor L domain-containing protein [Bacteroidota bacterium]
MKKTIILLVVTLLSIIAASGQQITIDNSLTPQQLVEDSLVSGCVEAFNITYTGDVAQTMIGYFNSNGSSFDTIMSSGIVLASGPATNAIGPNTSGSISQSMNVPGDTDLNALIPQSTNDASVLEFDFIPSSDTLVFKYVFGSDEYLEFVNSSFNDVFAFFLSGPSPYGGSYSNENIALVPGTTTPVSINNVNNVSYANYYINNGVGTPGGNGEALQYDGYTVGMYASASVIACETYHIKLAVADAGDSALDSGVFIETGSFTDGTSVTLNNVNPAGTLNDLYEGCESFYVFTRTDTTDLSFVVDIQLSFGGTATMGSDITTFPTMVTIPIGQISDTIFYTAIMDGVQESVETFIIEILAGCPCDPTPTGDTITIYDYVEFKASIVNTDSMYCGTAAPATLDLEAICISHPAWFIDYYWNTGSTDSIITIIPPPPGNHDIYWVEISDLCGNVLIDSITIGVSNLSGLLLNTSDALCYGICNGTAQVTPLGSNNGVYYVWSDPALDTTLLGSVYTLCADNYTVTVTDDSYCYFDQNFTIAQPNAALDPSSGILPIDTAYCSDPGQLTINAYANIPDVTFSWNGSPATNDTFEVSPIAGQNLYYVEIEDFCGYTIYDEVTVYVSNVESSNVSFENMSC